MRGDELVKVVRPKDEELCDFIPEKHSVLTNNIKA